MFLGLYGAVMLPEVKISEFMFCWGQILKSIKYCWLFFFKSCHLCQLRQFFFFYIFVIFIVFVFSRIVIFHSIFLCHQHVTKPLKKEKKLKKSISVVYLLPLEAWNRSQTSWTDNSLTVWTHSGAINWPDGTFYKLSVEFDSDRLKTNKNPNSSRCIYLLCVGRCFRFIY